MGQPIRELSIVRTFSDGITVGRGRNWGKKLMQHMLRIMYYLTVTVTCHPAEVTFQPKLALDLATMEECKAELT